MAYIIHAGGSFMIESFTAKQNISTCFSLSMAWKHSTFVKMNAHEKVMLSPEVKSHVRPPVHFKCFQRYGSELHHAARQHELTSEKTETSSTVNLNMLTV